MSGQGKQGEFPPLASACLATLIVCIIAMSAYVDRNIIAILIQPMRATLGISDTQIGLLQGVAFILFYSFMGIPLGRLVDRSTRKNLLSLGVIIWSLMTIGCGFSSSFELLFVARMGVGVGEAILAPAAFSLVADLFPPSLRGRAISAVTLSGALGGGLSFILGGTILDIFPASVDLPVIGTRWDWQIAFLIAGTPGLLIGILTLLIREPPRQERVVQQEGRGGESFLRYAFTRSRTFFPVYIAHTLLATVAYSVGAWVAAYFIRRFGLPPAQVGVTIGLLVILAAFLGGFGGGVISDFLSRRRLSGRIDILILTAAAGTFSLPIWPLMPDPIWGFGFLGLMLVTIQLGTSTASATIQEILPNHLRGEGLGYYFLFQGIIAQGMGPILVTVLKDYILQDEQALNWSIIYTCVPALICVGLLAFGVRHRYAAAREEVLINAGIGVAVQPDDVFNLRTNRS